MSFNPFPFPTGNTITTQNDASQWSPNFQSYGDPLLVWGTENIIQGGNSTITGYIVTSCSVTQRIEEIDISQGAGFTAIVVVLIDGLDINIEVIDSNAITPPTILTNVILMTQFGAVNGSLMVKNEANQAVKREGHRSFTFKTFNAITGLH